jgi:hypothetical protein
MTTTDHPNRRRLTLAAALVASLEGCGDTPDEVEPGLTSGTYRSVAADGAEDGCAVAPPPEGALTVQVVVEPSRLLLEDVLSPNPEQRSVLVLDREGSRVRGQTGREEAFRAGCNRLVNTIVNGKILGNDVLNLFFERSETVAPRDCSDAVRPNCRSSWMQHYQHMP